MFDDFVKLDRNDIIQAQSKTESFVNSKVCDFSGQLNDTTEFYFVDAAECQQLEMLQEQFIEIDLHQINETSMRSISTRRNAFVTESCENNIPTDINLDALDDDSCALSNPNGCIELALEDERSNADFAQCIPLRETAKKLINSLSSLKKIPVR
jgi:hypothetical protein